MVRHRFRPRLESLEDRYLLTTVTTLNDDGSSGSLRAAIANTPANGTVDFASGLSGTITLLGPGGELPIRRNLTINGPGASVLTVSGNGNFRVFEILPNTRVTISGLTIANGRFLGTLGGNAFGGGLLNSGTLNLNNCEVVNNTVVVAQGSGSAFGGGIANQGVMTLNGTTITGNNADGGFGLAANGGGIANTGAMTITSSTIVGNTATGGFQSGFGGGIATTGGGNLTFFSDTVAANTAANGGVGGGLFIDAATTGTIVVRNTIIALDTAATGPDISGFPQTADHDLIGDGDGTNIPNGQNGNRVGSVTNPLDPILGALKNNGGSTRTRALLAGSQAIDGGTTTNLPDTDQRGFNRIVNNTPDIGAYEFQPPATTTTVSVSPLTAAVNQAVTLTITVQGSAPGSNRASGTVAIFDGSVQLGTANLNDGQASFTATFPTVSTHNLSARYMGSSQGDFRFDPGNSNVVTETIIALRFFAVGGAPGRVQLRRSNDGSLLVDFAPYGNDYTGSVTVAVGDINGDGFPDVITGAATGNPNVKVFDGKALANNTFNVGNPDANTLASFFPYALQFNVGANVAVGDIEKNGFPDIVTGATVGNPDVRVYRGKDIAMGIFNPNGGSQVAQFFPFGLNFNVGANVAVGDVNGDGFADVVVGATAGNPNVKVYNGKDIAMGSFNPTGGSLLASFFPFALQFNVGAFVAVGDVNGDGFGDIIAGASIGNPDVRVYSGQDIANRTFNPAGGSQLTQFFAYGLGFNIGVTVGARDFDNDGKADIVTGSSVGSSNFRVVDGLATGVFPPALNNLDGFATDVQGGIFVSA